MIVELDPRKWSIFQSSAIPPVNTGDTTGDTLFSMPPPASKGIVDTMSGYQPSAPSDYQSLAPVTLAPRTQEKPMATAPVVPSSPGKFKSFMAHVIQFATLGLVDIIKYTPKVEVLAETLFPEYAGLEKAAAAKVVAVANLVKNGVITVQAKYASATSGDATNKAKLADVMQLVEETALSELSAAGVTADTTRVQNAVEAVVAILKTNAAPAA